MIDRLLAVRSMLNQFAGDRHEPPHVHIEREQKKAKFWLQPVAFASSTGFGRAELMDIYRLISDHQQLFLERWHDYFGIR